MGKKISLSDWIEEFGGATKLAAELGLGEGAVRVWMRGEGSPRAETIDKLITLSGGRLTFETIYRESSINVKK